ncbi:MAG TPA: glycosyltransferase [Lentisphaeria bacterium]|nr:MAG: UDP-phosphate 4-deoxy-4-formamido-L-arabinose transferase [Lentisphaerae bacterium GWF2_50_93]HCE46631.1 glycosyltransferase [Lentisphaeria bacterium]
MSNDVKLISIIIPVFNEEESVRELADEVSGIMNSCGWKWECIWVDDGSTDGTNQKLGQISSSDPRHRIFTLERNFGQSASMAFGFRKASGEVFVTLDGDGQNDPAGIPGLVRKLVEENADMVNGRRSKRQNSIVRKLASRIANGFRNILTGENVRDVGCSLRAFRGVCVQDIPVFKGMHRFIPTLVRIAGYDRIIEMPVNHRPRVKGTSKYGIWNRLWVGIADTFAVCWMKRRMVYPKERSGKN